MYFLTYANEPKLLVISMESDDDEDQESVESCVKSWFYLTCDPNLLQIISSDNCTAKDL